MSDTLTMTNSTAAKPYSTGMSEHMFGLPDISFWYNTLGVHPNNVADLVAGILSDAQAWMDVGNTKQANHRVNRAKWIIQNKLTGVQ